MTKLSYKAYKENIFSKIQEETASLQKKPKLAIVAVNPTDASQIYMRNKHNACEKSGILCEDILLENPSPQEVAQQIQTLNQNPQVTAIILQLPLPQQLQSFQDQLTEEIALEKDVDGFKLYHIGASFMGKDSVTGCTPRAVMEIFQDHYGAVSALAGKTIAVVGRGFLVGKPLVNLLMSQQATVLSINSKTPNPEKLCQSADAVVLATDQLDFFDESYFSQGQLLIDVGIGHSPKTGKMCGCLDTDSLESMDLTAVVAPGGVGQLTQAMLMSNIMALYRKYHQ